MKWIYRIFTLGILGVAISFPFFIDNKKGEPMLSLPSTADLVPTKDLKSSSVATFMGDRTVYKWKDEQGGWHYGDAPPAGAKQITSLTVNTNTNVVKSVSTEKEKDLEKSEAKSNPGTYTPPSDEDLLSFERAKNILNETKDVAALMEARNQQLGELVGEETKK